MKENADYFLDREKEMTEYLIRQLKKIFGVTLYLPEHLENHAGIVLLATVESYQGRGSGNDPGSGLSCGSPDWLPVCTAHS